MKAAVTVFAGPPSSIKIEERAIPEPKIGWILIKIMAFGLNRSELFTRKGDSPGVSFPRIQGIECVGVVESDPSGQLTKGQKVAALMGGMGRNFDGSYAEYTLLPLEIVFPFESDLPWEVLGAIPEMFQTVSGSLRLALEVQQGETLLIRGGTSSIGILAAQYAKSLGLYVISTTRNDLKRDFLLKNGADRVVIDQGEISAELKKSYPRGVDKVLELIGTVTLKDSLKCIRQGGMVCMTGILGNAWTLNDFTPMGDIPSLGKLTVYMGEAGNMNTAMLQEFIDKIASGQLSIAIDRVFTLDQIVEAHTYMESNQAKGKLVVLVDGPTPLQSSIHK